MLRLRNAVAALAIFVTTVLGTAVSTAPTPLYPVYRAALGFDELGVTATFAVFALGAVVGLGATALLNGHFSRRTAFLVAGLLQAVAAVVLAAGPDLAAFAVGRILSGLGAGVLAASGTAYLIEAAGIIGRGRLSLALLATAPAAVYLGLGAGPLIAGSIRAEGISQVHALFGALALGITASLIAALLLAPRSLGASLPERGSRGRLPVIGLIAPFTAFMTTGLFGALTTTMLQRFAVDSALAAGVLAASVFICGAVGVAVLVRRVPVRAAALALGVAFAAVGAALPLNSLPIFVAAAALAGAASGALFAGALRTTLHNAGADAFRRTTIVFGAAYTGLAVPVLALGLILRSTAIEPAVAGFAGLGALLCVIIAAIRIR